MSKGHDGNKITAGTGRNETVASPAAASPAWPSATRRPRRPATRVRRGLILPAAVAAALLGAPAAHADGACNLRYVFNSDGSPVWSSMQANSYGQVSCSATPAIARWPGGTMIASADGYRLPGFFVYENDDSWGNYSFTVNWAGIRPAECRP